MPELPEVETIVRGLRTKVLRRTFVDVWTDFEKMVKQPESFREFSRRIKGKKILTVRRRGKNIIFDLSGRLSMLLHQKLTGHLLYGQWIRKGGKWESRGNRFLKDRVNTYIHLMFFLDNGKMLAFSDLRKFGKVLLLNTDEMNNLEEIKGLGPEPLDKSFTFKKFKDTLGKRKGKIKQVLMDQTVFAGIGNIYSDEALWRSKINPFKQSAGLSEKELKDLYEAVLKVLRAGIRLRGESISDFRDLDGRPGAFDDERRVYRRKGEKCVRCGGIINRLKLGQRSCHFCPKCQKV